MMTVTVFGLGFVGLTTAVSFADKGIKVFGIEINEERRNTIAAGELPFHEPGLDEALKRTIGNTFNVCGQDGCAAAVKESDCIYYCVGTPYGKNGEADLSFLFFAVDMTLSAIGNASEKFRVLVTKSTIPPTTTSEKIIPYISSKGFTPGETVGIANNPEFLREGHCWEDVTNADRIVLGVGDEKSKELLLKLYEDFTMPKFCVSLNTGEFIKYLSNTLLATMISFSNEMSVMADSFGGIDVAEAFRILLMDGRWNDCNMRTYVYPGAGYGGYCLPKDTNAIYALSKSKGFDAGILRNVIETNDRMPRVMAERIEKHCTKDSVIGILGLSFKPGSDDTRDTAAAKVIAELEKDGYQRIAAYDPLAMDEFKKYYDYNIEYCKAKTDVVEKADVLAILTAWDEFRGLDKETDKPIIDCRYML